MIADLKPYPDYSATDMPWAHRVPSHWGKRRTKFLFRERAQKGFPEQPLLAATQNMGVVRKTDYGERTVTAMKDLHLLKLVEPGDFVISLRSFQGGLEIAHYRGIISPAYTILEPRPDASRGYFRHFFKSPDFIRNLTLFVTGIREGQNIDYERLSRAYLPLPPVEEQDLMARFLEHANGRLERAIRAKRKVIALLNEQKQAVIHRAVTSGLDPAAPLKPSGIPWLGHIPGHWETRRFKFLTKINSGQVDPTDRKYRNQILIAPNHIESGTGRIIAQETADFQGADSGKYLVRKGQIIYSKIRPNLRKAAIAPCDCLCSADMYGIGVNEAVVRTDFFLLLLLSEPFTKFAVDTSMRVAMPKINREALADCLLWFPNLDEQGRIIEAVDESRKPFDTAIHRLEREIALLREYRTRLVADVVTGHLDVRPAAGLLPDAGKLDAPSTTLDAADDELEDAIIEDKN
jgi:type I restriction enzyme S subunit